MPDLTPNHKDFVKAIVETKGKGRIRRAYQKVYPQSSNLSANANASKLLARPDIKQSLIEAFEAEGLTKEQAIREHCSIILKQPLKAITYSDKLIALNLYYKLNSMLDTNSDSLTLNQQFNLGATKDERDSLKAILSEISKLNERLLLKESSNDSDNVIDNDANTSNADVIDTEETASGKE